MSDRDDFGHPVTLNYNRRGSTHNTVFGGLISLIINCFMLLFTVILADQMFAFERDQITTLTLSNDLEQMPPTSYQDLGFLYFFSIASGWKNVAYDDTFKRHLRIYFSLWTKNAENKYSEEKFGVRLCTPEDFGETAYHQEKYEKHKDALCPDDPKNMIVQGSKESEIYKYLSLKIVSCQMFTGHTDECETD